MLTHLLVVASLNLLNFHLVTFQAIRWFLLPPLLCLIHWTRLNSCVVNDFGFLALRHSNYTIDLSSLLVSRSPDLFYPIFLSLFTLLELKATGLVIHPDFLFAWSKPSSPIIVGSILTPYKYHSKGRELGSGTLTYILNSPTFSTDLVETATFWRRLWGLDKTAPTKHHHGHKVQYVEHQHRQSPMPLGNPLSPSFNLCLFSLFIMF